MGRYETMFSRVEELGQGAFIPFVVIGDPESATSLDIIHALIAGGADALELGIPFSDPIADGPTIQTATVRALRAGVTPDRCFELLKKVREDNDHIPIGLLVYANLVVANGEDAFYKQAADAGVDSVLVADVPVFEAEPFVDMASNHGIDPVFIAPPNADEALLEEVARLTRGYTYVVARPGVTGANDEMAHRGEIFAALKKLGAPPGVIGFGISKPEHVRAALQEGASGAISGSAVVRIVERLAGDSRAMLGELEAFVRDMKEATKK
ncbi:MAG: tryptophan synthase subunit alpha [Deltaproteobacteria bacterium]|nr:tryptophan synthase subunit alpha [Deltaproteobacteria bacterium]